MSRRMAGKMLWGGVKITTYNTTVPDGHYTSGSNSVPVYYDTAIHYNTTYSQTTSVSGTRQTSHQTSLKFGPAAEPQWTYFDTFYNTSINSTWTTSWLVDTWYPQQTYYYSNQRYCYWTDTSYSQQTWRETTW